MSDTIAPNAPTGVSISDDAKSAIGDVDLPSGYLDPDGNLHTTAVIKEITGEEEDILTSRRMQAHVKMQKVLENCVVSIGPIKAEGNRNWSDVIRSLPATDRLHLIIQTRILTLGNAFTFKTKCPVDSCGYVREKVVDLADFKIVGMPDPMQRTWKGTLPGCQQTFTARIQTGVEEEKLAKAEAAKQDGLSMGMLARLIDINGQMPVTLKMIKKLGLKDRGYLRDQFKAHEGKIDNEVEVACDECGQEFKTYIDVADRSFFFPSET